MSTTSLIWRHHEIMFGQNRKPCIQFLTFERNTKRQTSLMNPELLLWASFLLFEKSLCLLTLFHLLVTHTTKSDWYRGMCAVRPGHLHLQLCRKQAIVWISKNVNQAEYLKLFGTINCLCLVQQTHPTLQGETTPAWSILASTMNSPVLWVNIELRPNLKGAKRLLCLYDVTIEASQSCSPMYKLRLLEKYYSCPFV